MTVIAAMPTNLYIVVLGAVVVPAVPVAVEVAVGVGGRDFFECPPVKDQPYNHRPQDSQARCEMLCSGESESHEVDIQGIMFIRHDMRSRS